MFQNYNKNLSQRQKSLLARLRKLQERIQRKIYDGSFAKMTRRKRLQLLLRLRRYALQLQRMGYSLRAAGSALALALSLTTPAAAQTFTEQIGGSNPFNTVDVGYAANPTFMDIDNDGDLDAFTGEFYGTIKYYKNTGTNVSPAFAEQTGGSNPFNTVDVGIFAISTFTDIDNDGDFDAFIGNQSGTIKYYKNTGTIVSPAFTEQTGSNNPFNTADVGSASTPTFADIDNDGDFDAFIGEAGGTIKYYKNTGTNVSPTFTEQTGGSNPFNTVDVGSESAPTFTDIDNDGDFDAFIGNQSGTIKYYKNTGTNVSPAFTEQTGGNNPFNAVNVGTFSNPTFTDIDNDGDLDAFIGLNDGTIH